MYLTRSPWELAQLLGATYSMHICERVFVHVDTRQQPHLLSFFTNSINGLLGGFQCADVESMCDLIVTFSMHILIFAWIT